MASFKFLLLVLILLVLACVSLVALKRWLPTIYDRLRQWADPSRVLGNPPEYRDDPHARLDWLDEALVWHRRRQARADALRSGFWASTPAAMIAVAISVATQIKSLPDVVNFHFWPTVGWDVLSLFLLMWLGTRIGAATIERRSGQKVAQYARERIELRRKMRIAETPNSSEAGS